MNAARRKQIAVIAEKLRVLHGEIENLKSQKYMKSDEFKLRQLWLEFVDAAGIALRTIAEKIEGFREWFKKWRNKPMKNKFDNRTLELDFTQEKPENKKLH